MAVSKRLRFEILRRDNHTCRYCGASAPDVPLRVDHVVPVALGGSDEPSNLVTACEPCNTGKSSMPADATIVADVANDALRWSLAMDYAAEEFQIAREDSAKIEDRFTAEWQAWKGPRGNHAPRPDNWPKSIHQLLRAGLRLEDLIELIDVAMTAHCNDTWRYFCGCCRTRVRQLQERATEVLKEELFNA